MADSSTTNAPPTQEVREEEPLLQQPASDNVNSLPEAKDMNIFRNLFTGMSFFLFFFCTMPC